MSSPTQLVDTNVISELARARPNPGILRWAVSVSRVALSVVTVEEVSFGLAWRPNSRVADWFERFLEAHCEVLPVSLEIARRAGDLRGALMSKGIPRTQADMLIAATAQVHHLTLVTRNVRDFERTTVALLNPFS